MPSTHDPSDYDFRPTPDNGHNDKICAVIREYHLARVRLAIAKTEFDEATAHEKEVHHALAHLLDTEFRDVVKTAWDLPQPEPSKERR